MAAVQEAQPQEGVAALVLDLDDKVSARVGDTLDTALVLLVRADSKQFSGGAVLEADKTLFALG